MQVQALPKSSMVMLGQQSVNRWRRQKGEKTKGVWIQSKCLQGGLVYWDSAKGEKGDISFVSWVDCDMSLMSHKVHSEFILVCVGKECSMEYEVI